MSRPIPSLTASSPGALRDAPLAGSSPASGATHHFGRLWTPDEDALIVALRAAGVRAREVAAEVGHPVGSVYVRYRVLKDRGVVLAPGLDRRRDRAPRKHCIDCGIELHKRTKGVRCAVHKAEVEKAATAAKPAKDKPPSRWPDVDVETLRRMAAEGHGFTAIAAALGRNRETLKRQASKLGIRVRIVRVSKAAPKPRAPRRVVTPTVRKVAPKPEKLVVIEAPDPKPLSLAAHTLPQVERRAPYRHDMAFTPRRISPAGTTEQRRAALVEHVEALAGGEWTADMDLRLVTGIHDGTGLRATAGDLGVAEEDALGRYRLLAAPFREWTLEGQPMLLSVVRDAALTARPEPARDEAAALARLMGVA